MAYIEKLNINKINLQVTIYSTYINNSHFEFIDGRKYWNKSEILFAPSVVAIEIRRL